MSSMVKGRRTAAALGVVLGLLLILPGLAHAATVFAPTAAPPGDAISDSPVTLGMKFTSDQAGYITALRLYRQASNTGAHTGHLWASDGTALATVSFPDAPVGWQEVSLASPVAITANTTYVAGYFADTGHFAFDPGGFANAVDNAPLHAPGGANGVYTYGSDSFPINSFNSTNYWVDVQFSTTAPPDTRAPKVASVTPAAGAQAVDQTTAPTATFDEAVQASTVNATNFKLTDDLGATVAGSVSYNATTHV